MTAGSLFTGIGGFDLGLERAGIRVAWQVEINERCRALLARRFTAEVHTDVRTVERPVPVDLICGGFPCQDLSVAGRRAGLAGERSGLWHEFHRILAVARPRWCLIENVPGLLSSNGGRDFAVVLQGLAELGYRVAWRVLDAQYFGLAQRRKRVFIVGSLGDGRAAEVLLEPESLRGNPPPSREAMSRPASTLGGGAAGRGRRDNPDTAELISHTLNASPRGTGPNTGVSNGGGANGPGRTVDDAEALVVFDETQITSALNRNSPKAGDPSHPLASGARPPTIADPISANEGRTYSHEGRNNFRLHNVVQGVRRLTPRECERLQGFPDDWTEGFADSTRYQMLGNAVAVPCAEWIARRIVGAA